jgi:uncharacterized membrane protein (DUF2068 family)
MMAVTFMPRRGAPEPLSLKAVPEAVDLHSHIGGLRAVATIEALKGFLAILLTACLLFLLHKDVEQVAGDILDAIHMNPEHPISHAVLHMASKMTDGRLWGFAFGALAYATVRFVEAYGLWNRRVWAEWFALLSGSLYIPLEVTQAISHPDAIHLLVLVANIFIVLYMLWVRMSAIWPVIAARVSSRPQ